MDSKIYSNLKREYEIKKLQKEEDALSYKNKVFSENEILHKLDEKKNMLAIKSAKLMLISDDITRRIEKENLEIKLKEIVCIVLLILIHPTNEGGEYEKDYC